MLRYGMMRWVSKMVVLFLAALAAGNAQCVTACAFERCRPSEAPPSHCHHKSTPDKGQPAGAPCSHDISILDTSVKTVTIAPAQASVATYSVPLFADALEFSFHMSGDAGI